MAIPVTCYFRVAALSPCRSVFDGVASASMRWPERQLFDCTSLRDIAYRRLRFGSALVDESVGLE
jgi:hypothetical protein